VSLGCPLPEGWSKPETFRDLVDVDGLALHRAAFASKGPHGSEATGAAAGLASSPIDRAWFELLERIAILDAVADPRAQFERRDPSGKVLGSVVGESLFPPSDGGAEWRHARSNGTALHVGWSAACRRAHAELVERHRVLRAWYGAILPRAVPAPEIATTSYEWVAREFADESEGAFAEGLRVVGVFGFPREERFPLAIGWGSRARLPDAIEAATAEALQCLAFLWGEPLPTAAPEPSPTPMFHLESNQVPARRVELRAWLDGAHAAFAGHALASVAVAHVQFVDLTPGWMAPGLRVARATCASAEPLVFGFAPAARHLPAHLRVHPIA